MKGFSKYIYIIPRKKKGTFIFLYLILLKKVGILATSCRRYVAKTMQSGKKQCKIAQINAKTKKIFA